jgi:heme A synthase
MSFSTDENPGITIDPTGPHKTLRMLHRFAASLFGIVALFLCVLAYWYKTAPVVPTLILMLTLLLAMVGMSTPDVIHPIIATTNLCGGMLLCALLYYYLLRQTEPSKRKVAQFIASAVVFLAILSGAWVSANFATGSCEPACSIDGNIAGAFFPDRELTISAGRIEIDQQQRLILVTHYFLSAFVLLTIIIISIVNLRKGHRNPAIITLSVTAVMVTFSVFELLTRSSIGLAGIHNLLALLLLLSLVYQFHNSSRRLE